MIRQTLLLLLSVGLCGCQNTNSLLSKADWSRTSAPVADSDASRFKKKPNSLSDAQKAEVQVAIGIAAEERGDQEAALAAFERAAGFGEAGQDVLHRMAILHDRRGNSSEAAELYQRVLAITPEDADAHCDYGYSLYLQNDWAASESQLREAIRLKPDLSRARNILAMLLARTDRTQESLAEFARAGVPQAAAHANVGLAKVLHGDEAAASKHLEIASSLDTSNEMSQTLATYRKAMDGVAIQRDVASVQLASFESSPATDDSPVKTVAASVTE